VSLIGLLPGATGNAAQFPRLPRAGWTIAAAKATIPAYDQSCRARPLIVSSAAYRCAMSTPEAENTVAELGKLTPDELIEAWALLSDEERLSGFLLLNAEEAEEFLSHLSALDATVLISLLPRLEQRRWLRLLPPDDIADIIQEASDDEREQLLGLLDGPARTEINALLAYAEDVAGGLMNPRYARLRAEMAVAEAISYLRAQKSHNAELIWYGYVVDAQQRLVGVVSFRELVTAPPGQHIRELMTTDLVTVLDTMDQEQVSHVFADENLYCIPVVDAEGRMKGIVTADDIVDVVKEEATEDMQKIGGTEALDAPYLSVSLPQMWRKRASWLAALFIGETLTATAMAFFEAQISRAVVLALFIPLIISSGGNSGSQATTLVIRAMALGEVRLRDWLRVLRRELITGLSLGAFLGAIGFARILLWEYVYQHTGHGEAGRAPFLYTEHYFVVAITVAFSIVGVVLWGSLMGAMLPFVLRRLGLDPASASAPFVATLVDVTGIVIYFGAAMLVLKGTLL
jgi:magnesium transporter